MPTACPTGLSVTSGDKQLEVVFQPVGASESGGVALTGYVVRAEPEGRPKDATQVEVADTKATVQGLANGQAYRVAVAARNQVGLGPFSALSEPFTPGRSVPGCLFGARVSCVQQGLRQYRGVIIPHSSGKSVYMLGLMRCLTRLSP